MPAQAPRSHRDGEALGNVTGLRTRAGSYYG